MKLKRYVCFFFLVLPSAKNNLKINGCPFWNETKTNERLLKGTTYNARRIDCSLYPLTLAMIVNKMASKRKLDATMKQKLQQDLIHFKFLYCEEQTKTIKYLST